MHALSPAEIRARRAENPKPRARDFAEGLGLPEAALVAAHLGHGVTAIDATPGRLFPLIETLGEVMALTRNASCVHERVGVYEPFTDGIHAAMVTGDEIDMRMFPKHWVHGYAVEDHGKCSLQVFDAAGDAVHKVHLRDTSDHAAFAALVAALRVDRGMPHFTPRAAVAPAKGDPAQAEALRAAWGAMTDTHQFLPMVQKLGLNRLGANRIAGTPLARALSPEAVHLALQQAAEGAVPVMIFVGNMGCIQIHGGLIENLVPMGPWINVMDPRFNLHLRADHIAEVWAVTKPTRSGDAVSVEAFDAEGSLILQIFAYRKNQSGEAWNALVAGLPGAAA
ncbi:MAG: hemin-degrading factor [Gemmobacter sp.]|nr:hemin-degrading factor [Gemmobacter sp.]